MVWQLQLKNFKSCLKQTDTAKIVTEGKANICETDFEDKVHFYFGVRGQTLIKNPKGQRKASKQRITGLQRD